jgi:FkbM family methyltransferase
MGRFDRAFGLARSLAIYHGIPGRQRRFRRLYAEFVRPGDLVFDIGAHVGNRTRAFVSLGCHVVAVEPQPDFVRTLRMLFGRVSAVDIVASGVGESAGRATLAVSERTPTVTTLAPGWREDRSHDPDFDRVRWNRAVDVEITTLDALIAQYGAPAFVKIDVEGSEPSVLAGLTQPLAALSFEYLPRALAQVGACVDRLSALGTYEYKWSLGETGRLSAHWVDAREILVRLQTAEAQQRPGDVYARRSTL